jgi:acetylornithine deacetylase/succinyl-diaminopimelate desuccinylase-like protein
MPQAARLRAAVQSVRPECGDAHGAPLWSALAFVTDLGIPAASFGPGDPKLSDTLDERVALHDYLDSVRALAIFIAEHCGVSV